MTTRKHSSFERRLTQLGRRAIWLRADWPELVAHFQELGPVQVTTKNRAVTHIKRGEFDEVSFEGPVGLVLAGDIDLRLFTHHWRWAIAEQRPSDDESGAEHAIGIYDSYGRPMHELRLMDLADAGAFLEVVETFACEQPPAVEVADLPDEAPMRVDDVDEETRRAFADAWRQMEDTHEFFGLLREHGLDRRVALNLAPDSFAEPLGDSALDEVFESAEASELPIMIFASSGGCVQIHTGPVRVDQNDDVFGLSGDNFQMCVDRAALGGAWVVKKPTVDGIVTSVEFFDTTTNLAFQAFGERKPGKPELAGWREVVEGLRRAH